jgi:DNA primase
VIEYLLDILEAESKDGRTYKLRAREEILPFVLKIPNQIDQEHFEHTIAERLGTTKEAVHAEVERVRQKQAQSPAPTPYQEAAASEVAPSVPTSTVERLDKQRSELLGYLVALTEIVDAPIATKIHEVLMVVTGKETSVLREALSPEIVSQLLFTLEERVQGVPKAQLRADVAHAAEAFALRTYKEELRLLKQALTEAEGGGGDVEAIIRSIGEVQRKIGTVRYSLEDFT